MGVLVGTLIISGISYALWSTTKEQESINKISSGCLKLSVQEGTSIDVPNAYQTPDSEGLQQQGYTFTINNNCNHEEYVEVNLDIKNNNTLNEKNIRATLLYNNQKIIEPNNLNNLLDRETTSKDYNLGKHLTTVRINANSNKTLNLKIWLDENTSFNDLKENNTFESKIEIGSIKRENILASDYVRIISEENNQLAYDETIDNNLRYIGATPDNYVDFNGEKWRIIGVMNNIDDGTGKKESRIKLIRANSLGSFYWDYKQNGVGSSTYDKGSNDWSDSQLMMMLNPIDIVKDGWKATGKNYTIDNEGYVIDNKNQKIYREIGSYFNRTSGFKPAQATTTNFTEESVDFSSNGLKNESKNLINKVKFNLGAFPRNKSIPAIASNYYEAERSTNVFPNRPATWIGYVGLMYLSDFSYATSGGGSLSRKNCLLTEIDDLSNNTECLDSNWLYTLSTSLWSITHRSDHQTRVEGIKAPGTRFTYGDAGGPGGLSYVFPVTYLKSDVLITSGEGTKNNSFKLAI